MKTRIALLVVLGALSLSAVAEGPKPATPSSTATATFNTLKGLVGEWQADSQMGKVTARYELVSDGHVLLEHLDVPGEHDNMITAYYLDGDKLALTHYCGIGNQPRMTATGIAADGAIHFQFAGAANLASAADKHMHEAVVRIVDNDHFNSDWTLFDSAKPAMTVSLRYARVK